LIEEWVKNIKKTREITPAGCTSYDKKLLFLTVKIAISVLS